jgi:poly(A) polymerase
VQPKTYHATEHDIDSSLIDSDALYIIDKLRQAGYKAYLVGGSVRDLLVKKEPKDFDISTSAKPEEIKQIFHRQCILIGRRFRLAHIRFGHKIIEVSTFRSGENEGDLIIQDNVWGSPEEDVLRRDFTINGLFYDPVTHSIIDFVGGWEDIKKRVLRTIGPPEIRFKQDPVRMIRLLKFRARFGFEIDPLCRKALLHCKEEILKSSPARILEEIFRMLESGAGTPFFNLMKESGLLKLLFPQLALFLEAPEGKWVYHYLSMADKINLKNIKKPLERGVLTSCLVFPILEKALREQYLAKKHIPHLGEVMTLTSSVIKNIVTSAFSHFPRRISSIMAFILTNQYRLTPLGGKKLRPRLFRSKEFGLALQFLQIRAMVDKKLVDTYNQWMEFYKQNERPSEHTVRRHPHTHPHNPRERKPHKEEDHARTH